MPQWRLADLLGLVVFGFPITLRLEGAKQNACNDDCCDDRDRSEDCDFHSLLFQGTTSRQFFAGQRNP